MVQKTGGFHVAFCLGSLPKIAYLSSLHVAYFVSVKGIHYFQVPRFESMLCFARVLVDFIITACLKWKDGLNNYLFSLLFFISLHYYSHFVTRLADFVDFFQLFSLHLL